MNVVFTIPKWRCGESGKDASSAPLYVRREVVVDHEGYLLDVDASCPDIGSDEDTAETGLSILRGPGTVNEGTYEVPLRNSAMMASRSFCTISPCIEDTVKLDARIFSVNQST